MAHWPELIFAIFLVLILPGWKLRHSLQKNPPKRDQAATYRSNMLLISTLLLILTGLMFWSGRPAAALGLVLPPIGLWCLGISAALLAALAIANALWERSLKGEKLAQFEAKMAQTSAHMPATRAELKSFLILTILLGCGWELLYRGFLMLVLTPLTGSYAAVALAALAYGAGHGYQSKGQFVGSIISAFLFTIGYVATGSLWWLMLVHTALPASMAITAYLFRRARPMAAATSQV